ncbi:MAG TPA: MFS transporter [Candidatus Deferrimicrobium sp.]|nr:MFS transporter [Candidatus Deferrimicrobium sp.]
MTGAPSLWRKDVVGWALYDFANTIYSMNVVSLYLKRHIVEDLGHSDHWFDIPFAISMALAAGLLPALGAMSDHTSSKKAFLFMFTLTCCVAVSMMTLVPASLIMLTLALFVIANFAYEAGQPFYNSLLYSVADGAQARFVSGIGVSLGYVGSILGMLLVLPFVTGTLFSWEFPLAGAGGKQAAFLPTGILFLALALPLFLWVSEIRVSRRESAGLKNAYQAVWEAIRGTKRYPGVLRFLIADYFFEDAVATVIINIGLYCSVVLSFSEQHITTFLIVSTLSAVAGSFLIGKLSEHRSLKKLLGYIVWGWAITLLLFVLSDNAVLVWILGSLVGILLGGLWTTSRPLLAEMVPREDLGRFFGLFSLSGRAAAVVGPLLWTAVVYFFNSERALGRFVIGVLGEARVHPAKLPYQMAVVALAVMMLLGLLIFRKVPDPQKRHRG